MKIYKDGIVRDMTPEEVAFFTQEQDPLPYKDRVINRIRERYTINDEIAILRQRDTKPDEYKAYNDYVEQIKAEEKARA